MLSKATLLKIKSYQLTALSFFKTVLQYKAEALRLKRSNKQLIARTYLYSAAKLGFQLVETLTLVLAILSLSN